MQEEPLVGVVIPMWNASATIDATIASVCRQTYQNLDIIVVDDGSTDNCVDKVQTWIRFDSRLRLVRQANSGVAAARNFGAANTRADYLAFLDSDDLWAPEKIELQVKVLRGAEQKVGLVYSWYAYIDAEDRVLSLDHQPQAEGRIFVELLQANVVGNGSSALFRRSAFEQARGFDPTLRERNAQGCEDLAIFLRVAEHFEFRVIQRHLVGYRLLPGNMSNDVIQMLRSCTLVLSEYRERYPELNSTMDSYLNSLRRWLLIRLASVGRYEQIRELAKQIWHTSPGLLLPCLLEAFVTSCRMRAPLVLKKSLRPLLYRSKRLRVRYLERSW